MEQYRLATLDENGKLHPDVLPGGASGEQYHEAAFAFSGTLAVGSGAFYWLTPPAPIRLLRLSIVLGVLGTGGGSVAAALLANGAPVGSVSVAAGSRLAASTVFDPVEIPANQLLSADITQVPTAGATRPGFAVVQALWEYA